MKRRELVVLLGGAAFVLPLTVGAQQKAMPVVGYFDLTSPGPRAAVTAAFRHGLGETGYVEGQSLAIEYRWAEGYRDRLPALAADLVDRKVDVIVAAGPLPALAAKSATSTIPIVFGAGDAVGEGLVFSLARPGGNLTGVSIMGGDLTPKRLELLSELVPQAKVIALLVNPAASRWERTTENMQEAALAKGIRLPMVMASSESEIDAAFEALAQLRAGALIIIPDPFFSSRRAQLVALASRHGIPTSYEAREYVAAGGLISYGTSITSAYRQVGIYAGRILKGEKPADLPVQQPTRFELVVNLKTATALGLTIPQSILARADEVIE